MDQALEILKTLQNCKHQLLFLMVISSSSTKFDQYQQAYSRMDSKTKASNKKQTASSLQRIEQSRQLGKLSKLNNEFSNSHYDNEGKFYSRFLQLLIKSFSKLQPNL